MLLEPALQLWETFVPNDGPALSAAQRRGKTILTAREAVEMGAGVVKLPPIWGQRVRHRHQPGLQQFIDGFNDGEKDVVWTLREQLKSAEVWAGGIAGTSERPCKRTQDGRFRCPGFVRDWQYLGPDTRTFGRLDVPCVWAHPLPKGNQWIVRLKGLPDTDEIRLIEGLMDGAPHIKNGGQVLLVAQDLGLPHKKRRPGLFHMSGRRPDRGDGLKYRRVDVANGLEGDLEIRISSKKDGQRWYCFDLYGTLQRTP